MYTTDAAVARSPEVAGSLLDQKLRKSSPGKWGVILFSVVILCGVGYTATQLTHDLQNAGHIASYWPYVMLGVALLCALGFEFVNGFHDTANAVATVIYTHSLEPHIAVVWSGVWNFIGVLTSSGLCNRIVAAGRANHAGGQGGGLCDGLRVVDLCHLVESEHVVPWSSGVQFTHAHRLDHRSGRRQSNDVGTHRNQRC